jgi:23S rRNA (guanosine2251-2'-O)-methyltransferase
VADGYRSAEIDKAVQSAKERGVTVEFRPRQMVAELAGDVVHQGMVAITGEFPYATVDEILADAGRAGEAPLVVLLDGITDPHNLGACLRVADGAGAHAVIAPKDRSVGLTTAAVKVASGAAESVPYIVVTNLARTMRDLRERACALGAELGQGDRPTPPDSQGALRAGRRRRGQGACARPCARRCDGLFHIPQRGAVSSLNASVAAAIMLYERFLAERAGAHAI